MHTNCVSCLSLHIVAFACTLEFQRHVPVLTRGAVVVVLGGGGGGIFAAYALFFSIYLFVCRKVTAFEKLTCDFCTVYSC